MAYTRLTELVERALVANHSAVGAIALPQPVKFPSLESLQAAANRLKGSKSHGPCCTYQLLEEPQDDTSFNFADVADQIQTHLADDLNTRPSRPAELMLAARFKRYYCGTRQCRRTLKTC